MVLFLAFALLTAFAPQIDVAVSGWFYNNGQFYLRHGWAGWLINEGIAAFLVLAGSAVFGVWLAGKLRCRWVAKIDTKVMLLTTGSMFLGPGLIVNGLFKSFWGRARPQDITLFGGDKFFSAPFIMSDQCNWDCSFMSGHTAIAFWSLSLALLAPQRWRKAAIITAVIFGIIFGALRIVQGYHFVSDVVFAGIVTSMVVLGLYKWLFNDGYSQKNAGF